MLNTVDEGIEAVRQGKIVIVVDDENRENEGDFIVSGEKISFTLSINQDEDIQDGYMPARKPFFHVEFC